MLDLDIISKFAKDVTHCKVSFDRMMKVYKRDRQIYYNPLWELDITSKLGRCPLCVTYHPYIINHRDFDKIGLKYRIMPTLAIYQQKYVDGPYNFWKFWIKALIQTLVVVEHLHNHSIVHGNITIDNIFVDGSNNIKLGEFAHAFIGDQNEVTHSNIYTPVDPLITPKWDIWMTATTFYHLLSNTPLFDDETTKKQDIINHIPIGIRMESYERSDELTDLFNMMLAYNPKIRFDATKCLCHPFFNNYKIYIHGMRSLLTPITITSPTVDISTFDIKLRYKVVNEYVDQGVEIYYRYSTKTQDYTKAKECANIWQYMATGRSDLLTFAELGIIEELDCDIFLKF